MSGIETKCLIVNVSVSMWAGQRLDKSATARVTADAQASDDAARVNKHLVPKEALSAIVAARSAIRTHVYDVTLPWWDNGDRLLPSARFFDFTQKHRQLVQAFDAEVDQFVDGAYLEVVQRAAFRMGRMFNPADYPAPELVRQRFGVALSVMPVPVGHDFRLDMDADAMDALRMEVTSDVEKRVAGAIVALKDRLVDTLQHFVTRLEGDKIWRNSTLTNLQELVETLPALNITGDPEIEQAYQSLKTTLKGWDANTLRKRANDKASVAADARTALDELLRAMGGEGGAS